MSFCSHATLNYDPRTGYYRCLDCIYQFEVKRTGTSVPEMQEPAKKAPNRTLPIVGIGAGLIFALAAMFMFFKLQNQDLSRFFPQKQCPDISKLKNELQKTKSNLRICQDKPERVEIIEVPIDRVVEVPVEKECPVFEPKKCPEAPKCPDCPKSYKNEFQQCMSDKGGERFTLSKCQKDLGSSNRKIEELRGLISKLTLTQCGKCPSVDVRGVECDCSDEIDAACGNLREAIEFYFKKSKSQPGEQDYEGMDVPLNSLKPHALIEPDFDEEDIVWDED